MLRTSLFNLRRASLNGKLLYQKRFQHSVIGIDLGTTNSAVALVEGKDARILENEEGGRTTPSTVAFNEKKGNLNCLVGLSAKRQAAINPQNTFFATKRLIGRKFSDQEVQRDLKNTPYKIIENKNGDAWLETTGGVKMSPSQIGSYILEKMKSIAELHLSSDKKPIKHAVVTVPAYFNDSQRQATKEAGKIAGLEILRVINEPTAAALAYGVDKKQRNGVVAVFDLGGGTFDISILDIEDGVFEVRATNGDTHLGGEDFDRLIMEFILKELETENKDINIRGDRMAMQRIREASEKVKIDLSHVKESEINIPFVTQDKHFKMKLTEDQLDTMSLHLINRTIEPVKRCIRDAELKPKDVDEILLVGGMTRMPKIRKVVEEVFGKPPSTAVNPDEAVALGAAIQGAVLSGQIKNVVLLDVTPLSLGIETYGGIFSPLIPRNSPVPVKKEQLFSTAVDGQTGVEVRVYQGERSLVRDNKLIGNFKLSNIPPGPKGTPQIAVSFGIDADGIISVSATDKTPYPKDLEYYDKDNTVTIQVSGETGLSEEEVNRIISESAKSKKADEEVRRHIENATRADVVCSDTENALIQFGDLIDIEDKNSINLMLTSLRKKIEDVRECREFHDPRLITNEVNEMQKACLTAIRKVATKQQQLQENKEK
ncbi:uncharacterized protein PRCAT00000608001 [Priceomyces carsonii]|uniref:uncharacterized protein n=1 Tax=Priceomyces carsonii TaxID=28549 RepID=UPI002ED8F39B|nr:unnamed protein product [Priceomyces carsonii]